MGFLNDGYARHELTLHVKRELGILARIALVFSRRGMDLETLRFEKSRVRLGFLASDEQLRGVTHDLRKLIDVLTVTNERSTVHELRGLLRAGGRAELGSRQEGRRPRLWQPRPRARTEPAG